MDRQSALLQTVAAFLGTDPSQVGPDFPLTGPRLHGSLARTQLYAAIQQRLGVKCRAAYMARTYGELQAAVLGTTTETSGTVSVVSAPSNGPSSLSMRHAVPEFNTHMSCGIDIEMVDHFPKVQDYWEDAFYATTFTSAEIAYCLLQENPRMHFAARWCAKEALKKCDPVYADEDMAHFEVAFEKEGAPFLRHYVNGTPERVPLVVSMSHSPSMAVAIVMKPATPRASNGISPVESGEPRITASAKRATEPLTANPPRPAFGLIPLLMVGVSVVFSMWAFVWVLIRFYFDR